MLVTLTARCTIPADAVEAARTLGETLVELVEHTSADVDLRVGSYDDDETAQPDEQPTAAAAADDED